MSTINVNYMTRTYNNFLKGQETRKASGKSMADTIAEKASGSAKTGEVAETAKTGEISTKDMTMDEYKQYIHDRISSFPISPSRMQDTISINISDAGFEAMKNDPEYEKWIMDRIELDFAMYDPWAGHFGGSYTVDYYGATKEEYHGTSWYRGCYGANDEKEYASRSKDSFWERKVENKQHLEAQAKKQQEKKRIEQEVFEKAAMESRFRHQRLLSEYQNRSMTAEASFNASGSSMAMSQTVISSYEASFVTAGTMI